MPSVYERMLEKAWDQMDKAVDEAEAKGEAKGKIEGKIEGKISSILDVLKMQFGEIPEDIVLGIWKHTDEDELQSLLAASLKCKSLEEFQQFL